MTRYAPVTLRRKPRVSVVIPCYNYGRFLSHSVMSVLSQPHVDVDILIIDDASVDDSGDIAEGLAAAHDQILVVRHRENLGHIATYNEGLARAEGEYIVLLSADDMLTSGALARATALLEAHPSVGFVYGHPVDLSSDDQPPARTEVRSWSVWRGRDWLFQRCRRGFNCVWSPEVVLRSSLQRHLGGYRSDLPHSADLEMWLRAASVADVGRVNGADQAYRRIHDKSMSQTTFGTILADLQGRRKAFAAALQPGVVPDVDRYLSVALRRIAEEAIDHACRLLQSEDQDPSTVDDYVSFAIETSHDIRTSPYWQELQWRQRSLRLPGNRARRGVYALQREVRDRVRWRRWYWSGV